MIYTKNKLITVNSKYGIQENGTMKSKMLFNYKNLLSDDENILKSFVTVINAQIPCSFYVINALNNKLVIAGPTITTTTIYVSYGNYNANTLITELESKISAGGLTLSISINKINGILTFSSNGFLSYYFTSASTILEILGTTSSTIATSTNYTCPYPLNLLGVKKLLIKSTRLSVHSVSTFDYASSNILLTIPSDVSPFSMISYSSQSEANKNLLNIRSINEIDINIYDENNNYIDFNNLDWTMTLVISSEVNFDEVLNVSWDTIRNEQRRLFIDEMNNKYIYLQQEPQTEEPPSPPIEESQNEKELKILNYKKINI
jgi:hypothetical protein